MEVEISLAVPPLEEPALTSETERLYSKLASWGYVAVEPLVDNPVNINVSKIKQILLRHRLKLSGLRTGLVYSQSGFSFSNPEKEVRTKAIKRIKSQILFSLKFDNKPSLLIGLIQGKLHRGVSIRQAKRWVVECLSECASFAAVHNVRLCLEPLNKYELEYHNTVDEVVQVINEVNSSSVSLLIDTFHMNLEEGSLYQSIRKNQNYIGHVHFADENREAPGDGHLNFPKIIRALKDIEYNGYITVEMQPKSNFDMASFRAIKYLRNILDKV